MKSALVEQFEMLWRSRDVDPDVFAFLREHKDLSPDESLSVLLTDQRFRWKSEAAIPVEEYLGRLPDLRSEEGVKLQLVLGELQARETAGATPDYKDYLARFADLAGPLESRFAETSVPNETVIKEPQDQIDDLCDEFEEAWVDGGEPALDEFLENGPGGGRGRVLSELLQVELWWRRKRGEQPDLKAYCARYPNYVENVRAAFGLQSADDALGETVINERDTGSTVRRKLDDRQYRVVDEVARGGMGVVHRVWDDSLARHVAMKVIRGDGAIGSSPVNPVDSAAYQRFVREAEITGQLDHPGVVPIHELGVDEQNRTYFTMRLIDGDNLHQIYQRVKDQQSSWTQTRAVGVIINVCNTIAFAHSRNIIHRDLKPENVMVGQFGETYVMDWGLAKSRNVPTDDLDEAHLDEAQKAGTDNAGSGSSSIYRFDETMDGSILGTPAYMPPEQAAGKINELDDRSDIYSIGAMLYELLAGDRPYRDLDLPPGALHLVQAVVSGPPTSLSMLNPTCPAELVAICEKAMARTQADRYACATEMSEDLQAYREGRVVQAHRTGPWIELKKWIGRNRALATAMGSAVLIAVVGMAAVINIERSKNEELKTANEKTTQERNYAQSLYLAQQSIDTSGSDPALALLLAKQSLTRDSNPSSRTAFYTAAGALNEKKTLIGHSGRIWRTEFSPDGTRCVTTSDDTTVALWDVSSGERLAVWDGHIGDVRAVAWSPDGRLLATGGSDSRLIVRDAETGEQKWSYLHTERVWSLDFSPDSKTLVSASSDSTCIVWRVEDGQKIKSYESAARFRIAKFGPSGSLLAAGTHDGEIQVHDQVTGQTKLLAHATGGVELLGFSKSGDRLMSSDRDQGGQTVNVWNPRTGEKIASFDHESAVTAACMSRGGDFVVTGEDNGRLTIWAVSDSSRLHVREFEGRVRFVDISADERTVAICVENKVYRFRMSAPETLVSFKGHGNTVRRVRFSPDASLLLTCSDDRTARLWVTGKDRLIPRLSFGRSGIPNLKVSSSGQALCMVYPGKVPLLWSPAARSIRPLRHTTNLKLTVVLRSGVIVTQSEDRVCFWAENGSLLTTLPGVDATNRVSASPDGNSVLMTNEAEGTLTEFSETGRVIDEYSIPLSTKQSRSSPFVRFESAGGTLRVHDIRKRAVVEIDAGENYSVLADADGLAVTGSKTGSRPAQVWSLESGRRLSTLAGASTGISLTHTKLVADATRVITASREAPTKIQVWDTKTGEQLPDLSGHASPFPGMQPLPGGRRLITIDDRAVRLWDLTTASFIRVIANHQVAPYPHRASHDGRFLALTDAETNSVSVWDLSNQELWCSLPHRTQIRFLEFCPSGDLVVVDRNGRFVCWQLSLHDCNLTLPRALSALEKSNLDLALPDE